MTDIVERLRVPVKYHAETTAERLEAADEIERLRIVRTEEAELVGEIERLRRDLEIWRRNGGDILREAEIDRLRNESHADEQRYQAAKAEIERLQAEIDILRQQL